MALFTLALALGLATRQSALATICADVLVDMQLESVTVAGAPASIEPYQDTTVFLWGEPGAVRVTVQSIRFMASAYEERYGAQPDAGR